ncbi:MAG TPA: LysM peptidoglycan-binding domain-containing protein [Phycisphaerae bacterium]|nr:LysM peptidoglycan-binding domain-containing protein [Phycisphaerae bacterium]
MRTDVKVGVVLSLIIVVAAGWYFLRTGSQESNIPVDTEATVADAEAPVEPPPPVVRRNSRPTPPAETDRTAFESTDQADETSPAIPDTAVAAAPGAQPTTAGDRLSDLLPFGRDTAGTTDRTDASPSTGQSAATESTTEVTDDTASGDEEDATPRPRRARSRRPGQLARSGAAPTAGPATTGAQTPSNPPLAATPKPAVRTHTVERGDTFSILAEVYYGSQGHTNFLIQANPQVKDPNRLLVGTVINIPPLDRPARTPPAPAGEGTYLVQEGDSFYGIAREALGDANRWQELLALNSSVVDGDPTNLRPGQVLKLPQKATPGG